MRCVLILRVLSYITGYDTRFCWRLPRIWTAVCRVLALRCNSSEPFAAIISVASTISKQNRRSWLIPPTSCQRCRTLSSLGLFPNTKAIRRQTSNNDNKTGRPHFPSPKVHTTQTIAGVTRRKVHYHLQPMPNTRSWGRTEPTRQTEG